MEKIYLVQKMERKTFKEYARKGVKVHSIDCCGQVITMWCESKRNAINCCREKNREQPYETFFVNQIPVF